MRPLNVTGDLVHPIQFLELYNSDKLFLLTRQTSLFLTSKLLRNRFDGFTAMEIFLRIDKALLIKMGENMLYTKN